MYGGFQGAPQLGHPDAERRWSLGQLHVWSLLFLGVQWLMGTAWIDFLLDFAANGILLCEKSIGIVWLQFNFILIQRDWEVQPSLCEFNFWAIMYEMKIRFFLNCAYKSSLEAAAQYRASNPSICVFSTHAPGPARKSGGKAGTPGLEIFPTGCPRASFLSAEWGSSWGPLLNQCPPHCRDERGFEGP